MVCSSLAQGRASGHGEWVERPGQGTFRGAPPTPWGARRPPWRAGGRLCGQVARALPREGSCVSALQGPTQRPRAPGAGRTSSDRRQARATLPPEFVVQRTTATNRPRFSTTRTSHRRGRSLGLCSVPSAHPTTGLQLVAPGALGFLGSPGLGTASTSGRRRVLSGGQCTCAAVPSARKVGLLTCHNHKNTEVLDRQFLRVWRRQHSVTRCRVSGPWWEAGCGRRGGASSGCEAEAPGSYVTWRASGTSPIRGNKCFCCCFGLFGVFLSLPK